MPIKTTDLFLVTYLLTQQIQPHQIITEGRENTRNKKIVFLFNRDVDVLRYVQAFAEGSAMANVVSFKRDFQLVRDWMFNKLREC